MNIRLLYTMLIPCLFSGLIANAQPALRYDQLPALPDLDGKPNIGVAGAFAGVSHGALLVAGGANFPNGYPWQNGKKVCHSTIYVLPKPGTSTHWQRAGALNRPLAYGASAVWNDQLICLGGNDMMGQRAEVFALTWDAAAGRAHTKSLPELTLPLANLSAAVLHDKLYAFGGESGAKAERSLFVLNLLKPDDGWKRCTDLPGPARAFTVLVALPESDSAGLVVAGGRQTLDGHTTVFKDAYQYQPAQNSWTRLPDLPVAVAAHAAAYAGSGRLLVFGGDDGVRLQQIEALNNQIAKQPDHPDYAVWVAKRNALQADHPGFRREAWHYQTSTRQWTVVGQLPFPAPVTTAAVQLGKSIILPSGEVSPGVRTPIIRLISPVNP
jgi:N-acetylneuraminic acid mutarotase